VRNDECLMSGRRASRAARHMTEDVATGASAGQADAWTSWTSWFAGEDVDEPFGSLAHTLAIERLMEGHDRRLPIPDALDYLWRRGVAEGYPLRRLYVFDSPLHLGVAGTYNSATGDVWVRLDAARPDRGAAEVEAAGHVLHEISHAARARHGTRRPATIPAYHRDEAATQRLAHRLAGRVRALVGRASTRIGGRRHARGGPLARHGGPGARRAARPSRMEQMRRGRRRCGATPGPTATPLRSPWRGWTAAC